MKYNFQSRPFFLGIFSILLLFGSVGLLDDLNSPFPQISYGQTNETTDFFFPTNSSTTILNNILGNVTTSESISTLANSAAIINDASASTNESITVNIPLSGSDANGDPITYFLASAPQNGVVTNIIPQTDTTATLVYTPNPEFVGVETFGIKASDCTDFGNVATVTITVNSVNTTAEIINSIPDYTADEIQIQFDQQITTVLVSADFDVVATLDDNSQQTLTISTVDNFDVPTTPSAFRVLEISGQIPSNTVHLFVDIINGNLANAGGDDYYNNYSF